MSDFFISTWPDHDTPIEPFAKSLDQAVDGLLRGLARVPLSAAPAALIERLKARSSQAAERHVAGSRMHPERGYGFRLAVSGDRVGVILQVEITPSHAADGALAFVRVVALFSAEEFKAAAKAIRGHEVSMEGISDVLLKDFEVRTPQVEQTLDYDLEFDPVVPKPGF